MNLTKYLLNKIQSQTDFGPHSGFLLCFSGGADSTALLYSFAALRAQIPTISLRAIHINHGLSAFADAWESHCQNICRLLDIPLIVHKAQVIAEGEGIEAAARKARYSAIAEIRRQKEVVVTAQHRDDQAETVLLNVKRGAGVHGLSAMAERSIGACELPMFRPFLALSKMQLLAYLDRENAMWVEDDSNQTDTFDRNFLRRQILPALTARWPQFTQNVCRSAEVLAEQAALLDELAASDLVSIENKPQEPFYEASLRLDQLRLLSARRQRNAVQFWVKSISKQALSQQQLQQFEAQFLNTREDAEPKLIFGNYQLRYFQGNVFLLPTYQCVVQEHISLKINKKIHLPDQLGCVVLQDTQHGTSDLGVRVKAPNANANIRVQFESQGLKIQLPKRQHSTKLKQWFKDKQIPPWQRQRIPLLFFNDELVAIGDFAIDKRFVATSTDTKTLIFRWDRFK